MVLIHIHILHIQYSIIPQIIINKLSINYFNKNLNKLHQQICFNKFADVI